MQQRILVVEDEAGIAENIRYALQTEGYDVTWCSTVGEARETVAADGIALVILDVGLPDGNGFDFCRDLRNSSRLPVIFLTARTSEIDRVVGLEIGADDYVVKPFSPRELCARVRAVLRRTNGTDTTPAGSPGFAVDPERMRITYHDSLLDLSRYEYRLLEVLVGRPGQVFTRDQLMNQVWEEPEASLDRTVDTHIKTLRAKLRRITPDHDPIKTHRGVGYSLREDQ
ncbi:MAG: two-component system response regulator CreB [Kiritimatiellia bacterium]|jgi:two-component system catabolic regulation response regulator CreB|nr:two-component system response regulator CreB [Kiritimatiellia bacterium]MDP6629649.1 two-component system response regulator CreB [Kiritimatiellia bacterium]MDP6811093.1 two-component system response regulator CreB [Kiritimatiellia bacterium]MDP7024446.1 two-component system response regulator CreB [Kiritimatiellia bacterium]